MIRIIKLLFLVVIIAGFWFFLNLYGGNDIEGQNGFVVSKGSGVNKISNDLHDSGLISSKLVFETWLWLNREEGSLQAGIYDIPDNSSISEIIEILQAGPDNDQAAVTILEGWDRNAILNYFDEKGFNFVEFENLTASASDWAEEYDFLADASARATLEGYIFPDTYFIDESTDTESLIAKTLDNFDKKLSQELRDEIERQGKSIFEVVTLASIIEREVPLDEDKKMIADIFLKRLEDGIGLQSDATINFITGKGHTRPALADLEIDSPYNTYKYRGLPPGPISNPGLASIEAVIYPTHNDYYYFLTDPEGNVYYAEDFDGHQYNRQNYLE